MDDLLIPEWARPMRENYEKFFRILDLLESELFNAPLDVVLEHADWAASFAWHCFCGILSSARLERLLAQTAGRLPPLEASNVSMSKKSERRNVVMVMTHAYETGGHSRMATRWIKLDDCSDYTLVLTLQDHIPVPRDFADLEADGGMRLVVFPQASSREERALALRKIFVAADYVVLNTHPSDVLPSVALGAIPEPPPVLYNNHASHAFWVGAEVSRLVLCGTNYLLGRRGVGGANVAWIPTPLDFGRLDASSAMDARIIFGIPQGVPLLFSCGASFKYTEVDGVSLAGLLTPLMAENESIFLLVAGAGASGVPPAPVWVRFVARFGERVKLVDRIDEATLNACYKAADVFLDSTPFSSPTTILEAAAAGVPVVRFAKPEWGEHDVSLDIEILPRPLFIWREEAAYRQELRRLLANLDYRDWHAALGRGVVRLLYGDDAFRGALNAAFARASATSLIRLTQGVDDWTCTLRERFLYDAFEGMLSQDKWETDWKLFTLAKARIEQGEFDVGGACLVELAEKQSPHWQVYATLGEVARRRGDLEAADLLVSHAIMLKDLIDG